MNREGLRVMRRVHEAWLEAIDSMKRMNRSSIVRPQTPAEIFSIDGSVPEDVIKFEVLPIVVNVPERANDSAANLYIVMDGWLSFEVSGDQGESIRTRDFGTRVAYFRRSRDQLEHIYGVHYDMDICGKGHPVFHAQIGSQFEFGSNIEDRFRISDERVDHLNKICRSIRTPTAQMDVFSVFTQICADHLMWRDSGAEVEQAFERTCRVCGFFVGAAHRLAYLQDRDVVECYRSVHWYGPRKNGGGLGGWEG